MDVIEQIINATEKKIQLELNKVEKQIDFNPFEERAAILSDLHTYINSCNATIEEFEKLKNRQAKNDRDIKRVTANDYYDKLFEKQNDLQKQLMKIGLLKMKL